MALDITKITDAKNALAQVQIKSSELNEILVKIEDTILKNADGTAKIDLTSTQKIALRDEYDLRKQVLLTAINSLL